MNQAWNIPRIKSSDTAAFGRLIMKWCVEKPQDRPSTIGEVITELSRHNISSSFPEDAFNGDSPVRFVETPLDTWVIRMPPSNLLEDTLESIRSGNGYPVQELPAYFRAYLDRKHSYDEDFFFVRLADYSVTQCG